MWRWTGCQKRRAIFLLAALLAWQGWVGAASQEEDYHAGSQAYHRGDVVEAVALLRKSADAGHAPSQTLLAYILDKAGAAAEAAGYYRKAAAQGDPEGGFVLGLMYAAGEGVERDLAQARRWITHAAEKGHAGAINTLASAYIKGGLGIDEPQRTSAHALRWVRKAADSGYLPAMEHLAAAYRTGAYGLAFDVREAEALDARVTAARGRGDKGGARKKDRR